MSYNSQQIQQLLDLTVSSSANGVSIPIGYGTNLIPGNIIWSPGLVEVTTTLSKGGSGGSTFWHVVSFSIFGGGSAPTYFEVYSYKASFAVAFCEGPGTITKIWGDDQLLYDNSQAYSDYKGDFDTSGNTMYTPGEIVRYFTDNSYQYFICVKSWTHLQFPSPNCDLGRIVWQKCAPPTEEAGGVYYPPPRFYNGTDDQPIDGSLPNDAYTVPHGILADRGVGFASAYRGLVYCVWEDFDLTNFGNKIPSIRALVQSGPANANLSVPLVSANNAAAGHTVYSFTSPTVSPIPYVEELPTYILQGDAYPHYPNASIGRPYDGSNVSSHPGNYVTVYYNDIHERSGPLSARDMNLWNAFNSPAGAYVQLSGGTCPSQYTGVHKVIAMGQDKPYHDTEDTHQWFVFECSGSALGLFATYGQHYQQVVYTSLIAAPISAWVGLEFNVTGFETGANNGGPWLCTANDAGTLTLANASGVAETLADATTAAAKNADTTNTAAVDYIVSDLCTRSALDPSAVDATDLASEAVTSADVYQADGSGIPALTMERGAVINFYQQDRLTGAPFPFHYPGDGTPPLSSPVGPPYVCKLNESVLFNPYPILSSYPEYPYTPVSDTIFQDFLGNWETPDSYDHLPMCIAGAQSGGSGPATWDGTFSPMGFVPLKVGEDQDQANWNMVMTFKLNVGVAGYYTFLCSSNDAVIIGIEGATSSFNSEHPYRESGPMVNPRGQTKTAQKGYPIIMAENIDLGEDNGDYTPPRTMNATLSKFVVYLPAAGSAGVPPLNVEINYGQHQMSCCLNLNWLMGVTYDFPDHAGVAYFHNQPQSPLLPIDGTNGADPMVGPFGYLITQQKDGRSLIDDLKSAFFFDSCESDFKLKFIQRGGAAATTGVVIPEDDLGLVADKKKISETIIQDQDQPQQITITYLDPSIDYQQGSQQKRRSSRIVTSQNQTTTDLPLALSGSMARQIAEKTLQLAWLESQPYVLNLWKAYYGLLDPTDVVDFVFEDLTYQQRLTLATLGQNFALKMEGVSHSDAAYASKAAGAASWPPLPPPVVYAPPTYPVIPGNPEIVMFQASGRLTGAQGNQIWIGACGTDIDYGKTMVWASRAADPTDVSKYVMIGEITGHARMGELAEWFYAGPDPDETNVLVVDIVEGSGLLEAGTPADADAGLTTLCFCDEEIIAFSSCVVSGAGGGSPPTPNQYTMNGPGSPPNSYIRRGAMGSTIYDHAPGGLFMMLDETIFKYTYDPSWVGQTVAFLFQAMNQNNAAVPDLSTLTPVMFTVPGLNGGTVDASSGLIISAGPMNPTHRPAPSPVRMPPGGGATPPTQIFCYDFGVTPKTGSAPTYGVNFASTITLTATITNTNADALTCTFWALQDGTSSRTNLGTVSAATTYQADSLYYSTFTLSVSDSGWYSLNDLACQITDTVNSAVSALFVDDSTYSYGVAVTVSPNTASVLTSGSQQFTAVVTGSSNTGVAWSHTGGGSITWGGEYNAPSSTSGSPFTVTATSSADGTKSGSASVAVTSSPVVAVAISPTSYAMYNGYSHTFVATVTGGTPTTVTFTCTGGSVTSGGIYTPSTTGTHSVTATSIADATKSATATVTVTTYTTTGGGGPGPKSCFSPNTKLMDGVSIGNTRVGDMVWVEKDDGTRVLRPVKKVLIHECSEDMLKMGNGELVTYGHHMRSDGGWVPAADLFFVPGGKCPTVWNLEIDTDQEDERNYVLANGRVAHNIMKTA